MHRTAKKMALKPFLFLAIPSIFLLANFDAFSNEVDDSVNATFRKIEFSSNPDRKYKQAMDVFDEMIRNGEQCLSVLKTKPKPGGDNRGIICITFYGQAGQAGGIGQQARIALKSLFDDQSYFSVAGYPDKPNDKALAMLAKSKKVDSLVDRFEQWQKGR